MCTAVGLITSNTRRGYNPSTNINAIGISNSPISPAVRSGKLDHLSFSGPLKTRCKIVRMKIAVTSRPITDSDAAQGESGNTPLKIRNSPTNPLSPGSPSDENSAIFDTIVTVRDSTCGAELGCDDDLGTGNWSVVTMSNVAAGTYAITIEGYFDAIGGYNVNVRGTVASGQACTHPLFASGVLRCAGTCNVGTGMCQ